MIDVALTVDVSTLMVQVFPVRVGPFIHSTAVPELSTILHYVYKQGLVVESVKYYFMSKLTEIELAVPDFQS